MHRGWLAGGFSTLPLPAADTGTNILNNSVNPYGTLWQFVGKAFGEPIDMAKGHYLYVHEDIQTGVGEFPLSLGVQKLYSSGLRTQDGPLGKGWTHSLAASAKVGSDGFQGMGEVPGSEKPESMITK